MPKTVFEVFLSSTSRDLQPYRMKVHEQLQRLGQASIRMETFGAKPDMPLDVCKQGVEQADAVVVLVGHRYGWIPRESEGGDGCRSITWWEVHWAKQAGKPVYAYLVDPNAPWTGEKEQDGLERAQSEEDEARVVRAVRGLKDFRAFLESNTTRELFTSADDLGGKVATTLANWLTTECSKVVTETAGNAAGASPRPV